MGLAALAVLVLLLVTVCQYPHELLAAAALTAPVGWAWPGFMLAVESNRRWGRTPPVRSARSDYSRVLNFITAPNNALIRAAAPRTRPIYSRAEMNALFPQHRLFEAYYPEIRAEAEALLAASEPGAEALSIPRFEELDPNQKLITDPVKRWRTFVLKFYGPENRANCARCPVTASLVRACPQVKAAMFSILDPGYRIPPHRGPSCAALRYHLAVIVPEQEPGSAGCFIRVDGTPYFWRNGEGVLFDDTYVHEVLNDTSRPRVVLFCDVQRRDLTPGVQALEDAILNDPAVQRYFARYNRKNEKAVAAD